MPETSFYENRYDSIQALRGIACLFIILEHIRFLNCGAFGVDIFFCISGFMIMFSTHRGKQYFLRKRLIRILPFYYLMTIGTYILLLLFPGMFAHTRASLSYLVKSLLFIPFDIGDGVLQPLMRIGWTINCEMFFYLLFFVAINISQKCRGLLASLFLIAIVLVGNLTDTSFAPLRFYSEPVMLEFVFGILVYYMAYGIYRLLQRYQSVKSIQPIQTGFLYLTMILIIGTTFALLLITKPNINVIGIRRVLIWGLPAMLITLCTFVAGLFCKAPVFLAKLGNISFSVYLIHYYPVQFLDRFVFHFDKVSPFTLFGTVFCVVVSILLGAGCWYAIEKKGTEALKKVLDFR